MSGSAKRRMFRTAGHQRSRKDDDVQDDHGRRVHIPRGYLPRQLLSPAGREERAAAPGLLPPV